MKHNAFSTITEAKTKFSLETTNIPMTQDSSHVKITDGDSALYVF